MHEQPKPSKDLREISHLFLSGVRDHASNGMPRPVRRPPGQRRDVSIDLTPEEFSMQIQSSDLQGSSASTRTVEIRALIASHMNGSQDERIAEYARHLAGTRGRVAMIRIDGSEFRLSCFESQEQSDAGGESAGEHVGFDPQRAAEAMEELSCDVDCWLLALPNLSAAEARTLLGKVRHWVLLSTCDSDGVVSSYRTLKGLAGMEHSRLSLALIDAIDASEADRVARRLVSVSEQFLHCPIEPEPVVKADPHTAETVIVQNSLTPSEVQAGLHWAAVAQFVAQHQGSVVKAEKQPEVVQETETQPVSEEATQFVADIVVPTPEEPVVEAKEEMPKVEETVESIRPVAASVEMGTAEVSDVVDLPDGQADEASILSAVMGQTPGSLVDCPVRPPMCPQARLAVSRDRQLMLLAVAGQGLSDLKLIGQAYRWLVENRTLVSMAVPQFAIDTHSLPKLTLLVDHADATAELLQPLLAVGHVTVRSYRKLRWGRKTGLLLDAA